MKIKLFTSKRLTWIIFELIPCAYTYYCIFKEPNITLNPAEHTLIPLLWLLLPIATIIFWIIKDKSKKKQYEDKLKNDFNIGFLKSWDIKNDVIYGKHNVDLIKIQKQDRIIDYLLQQNYNQIEIQWAFDKYYNDFITKYITIEQ